MSTILIIVISTKISLTCALIHHKLDSKTLDQLPHFTPVLIRNLTSILFFCHYVHGSVFFLGLKMEAILSLNIKFVLFLSIHFPNLIKDEYFSWFPELFLDSMQNFH
jgi:hypothetical protein